MNRGGIIIFAVLLVAISTAEAGKIYGSLQVDGQAVAPGTQVNINCAGTTYSAAVGDHGRYSVNVEREGSCSLSIAGYTGASAKIISYQEATRYNFLLTRSGNDYSMQRK
jgi:hypothetical protein